MSLDTMPDKPAARPRRADLKAHGQERSRISNGKDLLPDVDGRSTVARRYRDIASQIAIDQGGLEHCSESRLQLIRRFSACAVLAEQMEAALARGQEIDISEHALLCSTMTRIASRIGIDRIPKPIDDDDEELERVWNEAQQRAAANADDQPESEA
jgi:hypothetical protein